MQSFLLYVVRSNKMPRDLRDMRVCTTQHHFSFNKFQVELWMIRLVKDPFFKDLNPILYPCLKYDMKSYHISGISKGYHIYILYPFALPLRHFTS